jgi:hypothetical protein
MNYALVMNENGHIKSYEIIDGMSFEVKDKHLFVGIIWNFQYMSPLDCSQYFKDLDLYKGFQFRPIEMLLMTINNTFFKPALNDFRTNNEVYNLYFRIEPRN